ncbi:hypothetical protein BC943DRAFT_44766 [Umbelopsis sp. AD052]|nr:hypothetical protein BC943DRAFT_44766 [Umbelopsis sp. AD052]
MSNCMRGKSIICQTTFLLWPCSPTTDPIAILPNSGIPSTSVDISGIEQEQNGGQLSPSDTSTTQQSSENVVAVFVARFDVHRGNVIEWQYPADMNLDGVEYQAICSGLHSISQDTIYFKKGSNFGISAFENKAVNENTEERGARMMAVGCLVTPTSETAVDIDGHLTRINCAKKNRKATTGNHPRLQKTSTFQP